MTRARLYFTAVAIAALLLGVASRASAQCEISSPGGVCEQAAIVSMTIGRVIQLQSPTTVTNLTTPTPADFDAGFNISTGPVLTVRSNSPWRLRMRGATAVWGATDTSPGAPARTNKPVGDLRWSKTVGGTYTLLTTTDITLSNANATASNVTTLFYRTNYAWLLDTPGIYTMGVIFTLVSP